MLRASLGLACWRVPPRNPFHLLPVIVLGDGKPVPVHSDLSSEPVWEKARMP